MNAEDMKLFFAYNEWANNRILDAAGKLTSEQLMAPNEFGWGSLFGALVHILDAEHYWRNYLAGQKGSDWIEADNFADFASLRARWEIERAALRHYVDSLTDEDIAGPFWDDRNGEARQRPLWQFLMHVLTHGTQHRSECAALLTGFGVSPGDMDFTVFLSSR